jgi:thiol-disulfide isomerase/thioredoxin
MIKYYYCYKYAVLVLVLVLVLVMLADTAAGAPPAPEDYVPGTKVRKVVKLNSKSFKKARKDSANPVFLYMFSAYWCGHCKRLAPVLEATAPQVAGRLAIGKIDCTESDSKKVCDEFKVRGYPTLKFSIDGEMLDYTLGRTEEDFVAFADRLSRPTIAMVDSVDRAQYHATEDTFGHGVAFLCYDPLVAISGPAGAGAPTIDHLAPNSPLLRACQQTARKEMAHAHFMALATKADTSSITGIPAEKPRSDEETIVPTAPTKGGFVCRLEANVPSRCLLERDTVIDVDRLQEFVKVQNVATVTEFGPSNFHRIGRLGRPLVVGVADPSDEEAVAKLKHDLRSFAVHGPPELASEKYYFGYMDGVRWAKFLQQFDIKETPQVFVLNVPKRRYWQDPSYMHKTIKEFLTAVDNGTIDWKESGGVRGAGFLGRIANGFWSWLPWSLFLIVAMVAGVVVVVVPDIARDLLPKKASSGAAAGGSMSNSQSQPVDTLLGKKQR